jgi:hypothetical protein
MIGKEEVNGAKCKVGRTEEWERKVGTAKSRVESVERKGELKLNTEAGRRGDGLPDSPEAAKKVARGRREMRDGEVSVR